MKTFIKKNLNEIIYTFIALDVAWMLLTLFIMHSKGMI
jgi:hypothetical protein